MADENHQFAKFERADEYLKRLDVFLSLDLSVTTAEDEDDVEVQQWLKLALILDEYQEQSYLLDPYLEQMVFPVINAFRNHARKILENPDLQIHTKRFSRLSRLIHWIIKSRGYKTIVRFFPHQVDDLGIALGLISLDHDLINAPDQWHLRYNLLLWLSLICMIPFDLARFDSDDDGKSTASRLEAVGKRYLQSAGMECEGAALLLARLYTRKDTVSLFPAFLEWGGESTESSGDNFLAIGLLRVLCEIAKSGSTAKHMAGFEDISLVIQKIRNNPAFTSNTVVRKWVVKLTYRVALVDLPSRPLRARVKGRVLTGDSSRSDYASDSDAYDVDVPPTVEEALEEIFTSLQDRDTIVRWSAAKGLARITERLPEEFADQVLDTVLGLFSVHGVEIHSQLDIPASAESTWHGACLACAEIARRGLISPSQLNNTIPWIIKALYFDVRKGAHSVGSSVRDAAAYVLWSLARAQSKESIKPFANELARVLVAVSVFDKEIHIRRAASAAFQENVGRQGLFPHGIDVLRKTDFYAVSVRRSAFLVAAPQVAEHLEYRPFLIDHLITVSIRHWDRTIRSVSAQSLRELCELDLALLGPSVVERLVPLLSSSDGNDVHGALLALSELSVAFREKNLENDRLAIFKCLSSLPQNIFRKYGNELVLEAACHLIANSLSDEALQLPQSETLWRPVIDQSLKHREVPVQEAAAVAMAALSKLVKCDESTPSVQQSFARTLGVLSYSSFPHGIRSAIQCLLDCLTIKSLGFSTNVEARQNACNALTSIVSAATPQIRIDLGPGVVRRIYEAFISGLEDYTIDERGDVGSWIRTACIHGLGTLLPLLILDPHMRPLSDWLSADLYHVAFGGILKQGAERLDTVRREAGVQIASLLQVQLPEDLKYQGWNLEGRGLIETLFSDKDLSWSDPAIIFPKVIQLLKIKAYRRSVLTGIVLSIGSKNESTHKPAADSLQSLASSLPVVSNDENQLTLQELSGDLLTLGRENFSNNQLFIPVLQSLEIVLGGGTALSLAETALGTTTLRKIIHMAGNNADKWKSVPRILASMKLIVLLLSAPELRKEVADHVAAFLDHRFPLVRSTSAEALYVAMQTEDLVEEEDETAEALLLETAWSSATAEEIHTSAGSIVDSLKRSRAM